MKEQWGDLYKWILARKKIKFLNSCLHIFLISSLSSVNFSFPFALNFERPDYCRLKLSILQLIVFVFFIILAGELLSVISHPIGFGFFASSVFIFTFQD